MTSATSVPPSTICGGTSSDTGAPLPRVYIPAIALPFVVGIRLAFSLSVVGVILTELFAAKNGLGQVVKQAYSLGVYDRMTGSVVLLFSFALAGSLLIWAVEKRVRRLA